MSAVPTAAPPVPVRRHGWRTLAAAAAAAAAVWLLLVGLVWVGQERLIFRPTPLPADHRFNVPADVHETWVDVPGARLNALHLRLPRPDGVVFYLHGNGGNLASWWVNPDFYRRANVDLFMIDYRGYGKSSGRIASQAQLIDDVRAAWRSIETPYRGKRRILLGRSLGSGPAALLAAELQPELTLLVTPYSSLEALGREAYPWVPSAVLRYPMRSDVELRKVKTPVLLVHGTADNVIGHHHSLALREAAPQASLLLVPQGGHGDLHRFEAYVEGVQRALVGR